jgi:GNAT superfamily N-acetyltransferase
MERATGQNDAPAIATAPAPARATESAKSKRPRNILPGRLRIERGTFADYRRLEHFHYAPGAPAAPTGVWRVVYLTPRHLLRRRARRQLHCQLKIDNCQSAIARVIAVGVLAYPTPASHARERALGLSGPRYGPKLAFVNRHVRTIARIIVHPQFRGLGVAARLVRRICEECTTRYVEAFAAMGDVHPFFVHGGMRRVPPATEAEAAYFIFDGKKDERSAR